MIDLIIQKIFNEIENMAVDQYPQIVIYKLSRNNDEYLCEDSIWVDLSSEELFGQDFSLPPTDIRSEFEILKDYKAFQVALCHKEDFCWEDQLIVSSYRILKNIHLLEEDWEQWRKENG
jgi:hypothetical protein